MTVSAPYRSAAASGRDGFAQLLHAEWTKLRTVRGLVAGLVVAALLSVGVSLLNGAQCDMGVPGRAVTKVACPAAVTGPGGQAVTDSFYYVHKTLAGNGSVTVRVTALTGVYPGSAAVRGTGPLAGYEPGVQPWAKAGIMISASAAPGAAYAAMAVTGANGVRMQWNYTGDAPGAPGGVSAAAPRWLRLVRTGDTVSGYDSLDGTHWTEVHSVSLAGLPATAQAGLFATSPPYPVSSQSLGSQSGSGGVTLATASFDQLTAAPVSGPWTGTPVGADTGARQVPGNPAGPGTAGLTDPLDGSYRQSGGTFTVAGSGDIAPNVPVAPDGVGLNTTSSLNASTLFGLIALLIVSAMFITAEYRRGLIAATFAASPRRGRVLAAKAVVLAAVTFAVGLVATAIAYFRTEAILRSDGNWIPSASALTTVRIVVGTAALLAVVSVLALALGVIVRRGVAAVSAAVVLIVLPFLLAIIPGLLPVGAENWLLRVLPAASFAVQQALPAYHQVIAQYTPANNYYPLPWWAGFLVLCAWAALALAAGAYLLRRRDA